MSNPEKILKVAKKNQKLAGAVLHSVSKAQSKYIPKGKVFSPCIEKASVLFESSVISNSVTKSSTIELEGENVCNKEREKILSSEISELYSSSSKFEILKEEEVIELSSSFESQEEESGSFSKLELEQALEVAPYLNREILTEEDIKSVLDLLRQNPEIQSVIRTHQDLTSSFQNLSIGPSTPYQI